MRICVPKEQLASEKRVAISPEVVEHLIKLGYSVSVEKNAGMHAKFKNNDFKDLGAEIIQDTDSLWASADIILKIRPPEPEEIQRMNPGSTIISFLEPAQQPDRLQLLADKGVTALAMECIPRISRAQKMDALSSMANIAGYRAVIEAAQHFGRFFTGQITAAGKIPPAKVLVIGAGVAGLSAIGSAKSLGAIVRAFDTRPEVKEQVESMDGEFLMLDFEETADGGGGYAKVMSQEFIDAEMALFAEQAKDVDIIITTALIPGKPAPELITEDMVKSMKEGSVIVDLAAAQGGNCKLSQADKVVVKHGVSIIGYTDLPSRLATQASQLYATNLRHLIADMTPNKDGNLVVNFEDEVIRSATVTKDGSITYPPPPIAVSKAPPPKVEETKVVSKAADEPKKGLLAPVLVTLGLLALGATAPASFMSHFIVFVLACFVGYMVIWNVSPSLHTPLMSVTNAISSIIIIGALVQISQPDTWVVILSMTAVLITSINIVGGFAVTRRMLAMFRK